MLPYLPLCNLHLLSITLWSLVGIVDYVWVFSIMLPILLPLSSQLIIVCVIHLTWLWPLSEPAAMLLWDLKATIWETDNLSHLQQVQFNVQNALIHFDSLCVSSWRFPTKWVVSGWHNDLLSKHKFNFAYSRVWIIYGEIMGLNQS